MIGRAYAAQQFKRLEQRNKQLLEMLHEARELAEFYAEGGEGRPLPWLKCGQGVFIGHSQRLYTCSLGEGHEGPHRCAEPVTDPACDHRGALGECASLHCPVHGRPKEQP